MMEERQDGNHDHEMIPESLWADDRVSSVIAACMWCEGVDEWPKENDVCSFVEPQKTSEHWPVCADICHYNFCPDIEQTVKDHFRNVLKIKEEDLLMYVERFVDPLCYACPVGEAACVSNNRLTVPRHNVNVLVDHYVELLSNKSQTDEQLAAEEKELKSLLGSRDSKAVEEDAIANAMGGSYWSGSGSIVAELEQTELVTEGEIAAENAFNAETGGVSETAVKERAQPLEGGRNSEWAVKWVFAAGAVMAMFGAAAFVGGMRTGVGATTTTTTAADAVEGMEAGMGGRQEHSGTTSAIHKPLVPTESSEMI
jgi:hypothetical protein